jgi:SAM-dependent methyltransferase
MTEENLFADNAAYDRAVGRWSRVAGEVFLDWLGLPHGLSWLDVGCGTGAFTELVLIHNAPSEINGIDPSEGQIAFARQRSLAGRVHYRQGDATSMPYSDDTFDVAIMALVVQYVADPPKAISEIIRVVRQGGTTAAYVWTVSPVQPIMATFKSMGVEEQRAPSDHMRSLDALTSLFVAAGIEDVTSRKIDIPIEFDTFDEFWASQATMALTRSRKLFTELEIDQLKRLVRERLHGHPGDRVSYAAQANAVRGIIRK